jgi:hypothetical protein
LGLILTENAVDRVADDDLEVVDQVKTGRRHFCVPVVEIEGTRTVAFCRVEERGEPGR